jgi:hypothetical protein
VPSCWVSMGWSLLMICRRFSRVGLRGLMIG